MTHFYSCSLDPVTKTVLKTYLLKNIKNVEVLRDNIKSGEWKCAAIKASLILDPFQVAVAANRAAVARASGTMVTRTVFGEILYNLSLTKNITQSLSMFGAEKEDALLLCFLITESDDESAAVLQRVQAETCPMSALRDYTSLEDIKSVYKLSSLECGDQLLDNIVSRMVTKNFVSFTDIPNKRK